MSDDTSPGLSTPEVEVRSGIHVIFGYLLSLRLAWASINLYQKEIINNKATKSLIQLYTEAHVTITVLTHYIIPG